VTCCGKLLLYPGYPGDRRLFADSSLPDYEEAAAALLEQRVRGFLDNLG